MSRSIEWDGRIWPSISAVARHEGVDRQSIRYWLDLKPERPASYETTIRGVTYPSRAAAARALGVSIPTINGAASRGTLDNVGARKLRQMGNASGGSGESERKF